MNINAVIHWKTSEHSRAYLKLIIMSLLFGGTFIAGRVMGGEVPPALGAALRFTLASSCLLTILFVQKGHFPRPSRQEWFGLFFLGLTGVCGYNLFFLQALEVVEAGRTAAIIASNPILITLLSALFFKESLSLRKLSGILVSVSGAMLVASKGNIHVLLHFSTGDKALLGALCCWAVYSVLGKKVLNTLSPLVSVTYSALIGTLMLAPIALLTTDYSLAGSFSPSAWLGIIYLAIPGTVIAFLLFYQGIKELGVVQAGIFINLIPVSALILSILMLGETPDINMFSGTALVIAGVFLVNRTNKR